MTNEIQDTLTVPSSPNDVRIYMPNPDDPNDPSNKICIISGDGETMVTINTKTGDFEFAPEVTPQEAAVEFFRWVTRFIQNYRGDNSIDPPADGLEAEQLRQLFEEYTSEGEITGDDLQELMDRVDARDSLQVVNTIAHLREQNAALRKRVQELEGGS